MHLDAFSYIDHMPFVCNYCLNTIHSSRIEYYYHYCIQRLHFHESGLDPSLRLLLLILRILSRILMQMEHIHLGNAVIGVELCSSSEIILLIFISIKLGYTSLWQEAGDAHGLMTITYAVPAHCLVCTWDPYNKNAKCNLWKSNTSSILFKRNYRGTSIQTPDPLFHDYSSQMAPYGIEVLIHFTSFSIFKLEAVIRCNYKNPCLHHAYSRVKWPRVRVSNYAGWPRNGQADL